MRLRRIKIESLYLAVLGIQVFEKIMYSTLLNLDTIDTLLNWIILAMLSLIFCIYIRNRIFSFTETFLMVLVLIIFGITAFRANKPTLLILAMFINCAGTADFKKICTAHLVANILAFALIFLLIGVGVLKDYLYVTKGEIAHCFGFSYFHNLPDHFYFCFIEYLYLKKKKMKLQEILFWIVINIIIYRLTTIRLVFYLTFISLLLYNVITSIPTGTIDNKFFNILSYLLFPIGMLIVFIFMRFYNPNNAVWRALNLFSNARIKLLHSAYLQYPFTVFGQHIESNTGINVMISEGVQTRQYSGTYFYIDSGFGRSMLESGMLLTLFIVFLYTLVSVYSTRKNNKGLFIWSVSLMLFNISNNLLMELMYSPLILFSLISLKE